jgi:hypothetical protein
MFGQQLDNAGQGAQPQPMAQPPVAGTVPQDQSPAAPPPDHQFEPPKPAFDDASFADTQATDASLTPNDNPNPDPVVGPATPAVDRGSSTPAADPAFSGSSSATPAAPVNDDELLSIKQQALQHLSPLVGQLDQDPEEKFHTTMRIIQASDNHTLIKDAFDAATQIPDEKARAQALLDVVNEINYFTRQGEQVATEEQPTEPAAA